MHETLRSIIACLQTGNQNQGVTLAPTHTKESYIVIVEAFEAGMCKHYTQQWQLYIPPSLTLKPLCFPLMLFQYLC
jgi:hypothetical protein